RGQNPEIIMQALYAYTHCSISASLKMLVICENRPVVMDVQSVIKRNSEKLLEYLKLELETELKRLLDEIHRKTLAQIFIENRIYKDIEQCKSMATINRAVFDGVMKFREQLQRDVSDDDITMLLAIPIRRISLFDINKNEQETAEIHKRIKEINNHLKKLSAYAIAYLQALLDKYGKDFPRRTEIVDEFDKIDVQDIALKNIRVGWDRKNGYLGSNVKSDDFVQCNEFDKLLCVEREGDYKIINIPEKTYGGKLYEMRRFDPKTEFGVVYRDKKSGKAYGKRCLIEKFITDKVYRLCPENCRLELMTSRSDAIYELAVKFKNSSQTSELNLQELPIRSPRARGKLLDTKTFRKITWLRYLTEDENFALNPDSILGPDSESEISDDEDTKTAAREAPSPKKSEKKE
ncbi:MAG: DNA gyrase subunit A, partial [Victivallaceae bacterium]|nr:DNA gyrase subunit A [Victivallaceae bacterium]